MELKERLKVNGETKEILKEELKKKENQIIELENEITNLMNMPSDFDRM